MELEDDVFFADLNKQISLLITEDDDDGNDGPELPVRYPPVPVQVYAHFPRVVIPPVYSYEVVCRREIKGTGVFIPRSSFPRRKTSQTKQSNRTASALSHISFTAPHKPSNPNNSSNTNNVGPPKKLNG